VERHEDNLIDPPRRRLRTFECPTVVRALPPDYGWPAPQTREPEVVAASHRTSCRQKDGCVRPGVAINSSRGAWTRGIVLTQPGLKIPTGCRARGTAITFNGRHAPTEYRARVQSGWVTRCGTAITFNGRKAVTCPRCGLGIPRGADVALTQASMDHHESGDPSRVVLGTPLPAWPIWDALWAGDEDNGGEGRYALATKGERLQEIFAADPDNEELSERLRRVLARTLGFLLAEHRAYETDVMAALDAPPEVAPRRANRRDRAGLEFQRYVELEKRCWVDWSSGEDPAEAAPPVRVEYRIVDPAVRAIYEERHFVTAVRLGQAWVAWHALADQLKILQQKQTLQ